MQSESYQVKLNYQKPNGFWLMGHIFEIMVPIKPGMKEKQNHGEAERIAKKRYPGCEIVSATYV